MVIARRLALLAASLSAVACAPLELQDPGDGVGRGQAADARRDAAQHCAGAGVRQRPGTNGTSPGDYVCTSG